jgi:ABC-2 type transport system permease protein
MRQILAIAWKDIYGTFSDRNLVIIMIATPLAIATIVGLAFGNLGSGDVPVSDIPVAIVNQDEGSGAQNYGQIFIRAFVPPSEDELVSETTQLPTCESDETPSNVNGSSQPSLYDLTDAVALNSVEAARAGVDNGDYTAAIIVPHDFSSRIAYGPGDPIEATSVEVYANPGRAVPAAIIRSISESIVNQIAAGNIAAASTLETVGEQYGLLQIATVATHESFARNLSCAFTSTVNALSIEQQTVSGEDSNSAAALLVTFGSAQAMFFALFTGQQGVLSVFEERRQWTLQRLVMAPISRVTILLGKLLGTFVTCLFQLIALAIALTVVGSILSGQVVFIWGTNLLAIFIVMVAAAAAVTGLGVLMAGVAKTPEQSATYAQLINIVLALLGGAFGLQLSENLSRLSLIYWGADAFRKLSLGQGDITLNVLILVAHGVVLFVAGWWLFNRRLDI